MNNCCECCGEKLYSENLCIDCEAERLHKSALDLYYENKKVKICK